MSHVCARSWRVTVNYWRFCDLPRGHQEECSCVGINKPADAIWYEDDLEAQSLFAKQVADERKLTAKKQTLSL